MGGSAAIALTVATLATIGGRWVDETLMRATDVMLALPTIIVALGFAAALGPSLSSAIIAMTLVLWPSSTRLLRHTMRESMTMRFVDAARVLGASRTRLMIRHVTP